MARGLPAVTPAPSKTGGRLPMGKAGKRTVLPQLGIGVLLIFLSVAVYGVITNRLDKRDPVLVLTHRVEAGQKIEAADLRAVPMSGVTALGVFPAAASAQVIGQSATIPLTAGTVLTSAMVGEQALFPPTGQRLVSLSLKAGQYPQRLAAGAHVEIYLGVSTQDNAPATSGVQVTQGVAVAPATPVKVTATVYEVDAGAAAADGQSGAVVSLLLDDSAAIRLAGAIGAVLLMQMPAGA